MPSTFQRLAVDLDGDGRRDIVDSVPDAVGSTANFLKKAGWVSGLALGLRGAPAGGLQAGAARPQGQAPGLGLGRHGRDARRRAPAVGRLPGRHHRAGRLQRPGLPGDEELRRGLFLQRRRILRPRHRAPRRPPARGCPASGTAGRPTTRRSPAPSGGNCSAFSPPAATMSASRTASIGQKTRDAIKDVERRIGMDPTGRPGGKVLQALRCRLAPGAWNRCQWPASRSTSCHRLALRDALRLFPRPRAGALGLRLRHDRLRLCAAWRCRRTWSSRRATAGRRSRPVLQEAGASLADIVRCRYYVTDPAFADADAAGLRRGAPRGPPGRDAARRAAS